MLATHARLPLQTRSKYTDEQLFKLHETRSNIDKVRAEVEAVRAAEVQHTFKPRAVGCVPRPAQLGAACTCKWFLGAVQVPKYSDKGAEVKLTVAAVLREDALFRKKQEQEAALIKVGLRARARVCVKCASIAKRFNCAGVRVRLKRYDGVRSLAIRNESSR